MHKVEIESHGIRSKKLYKNASRAVLYEHAIVYEGSHISSTGALLAYSGEKTGRSPHDKALVRNRQDTEEIYADFLKQEIQAKDFTEARTQAIEYLNAAERLYIIDGHINWDKRYRQRIRIYCTRAYHALFIQNMLIKPTEEELEENQNIDYIIFNAGSDTSRRNPRSVTGSHTQILLSLETQEIIIIGSEYAGEMKKGLFTMMNYQMPKKGILSMHCAATEGKSGGITLLFGLSGTGKTTLSADSSRLLLGDDEHIWTSEGIANIEGGCYAKVVNLSKSKEPEIFHAIHYGTVLENVSYNPQTHEVNYQDSSITENTRASYPIDFIENTKTPCTGGHPKNIIFLTCDAFGVLPPVSKLSYAQAAYHFIMGYTAKIAGTEVGITEPKATFSACFGAAFMVWHPYKYAELLIEKIKKHNVTVWLLNTGWTGGGYGIGKRIDLRDTRAILHAIHAETLKEAQFTEDSLFRLQHPCHCAHVDAALLNPKNKWPDPKAYRAAEQHLASLFREHSKRYEKTCATWIAEGGPKEASNSERF